VRVRSKPDFSNFPSEIPEPADSESGEREEPSWRLPLLFGLFVLLVLALVFSFYMSPLHREDDLAGGLLQPIETAPLVPPTPVPSPTPAAPEMVKVYVVGAVHQPGVVTLPADTRVDDAIRAVGGMLPDADPLSVNLAKKIRDEDQIVVRSKNEPRLQASRKTPSPSWEDEEPGNDSLDPQDSRGAGDALPGGEGAVSGTGRLLLNQASAEELAEKVKGLGPALSRQIVEYREMKGPFTTYEDLLNVPGIGPVKLEEIKNQVDL
jgi:competence protein ComEA